MSHPTQVVALVGIGAVLVAACSGSPTAAEVNGETITVEQVSALSVEDAGGVIIPGDPFRATLSLLIANVALRTAAEDQFGLVDLNDPGRIAAKIASPPTREQSVFSAIEDNPNLTRAYAEGAAEFFVIRDAVLVELSTAGAPDDAALEDLFAAWATNALDVAEVDVRSQVGIWGGTGMGVLPPP